MVVGAMKTFPRERFGEGDEKLTGIQLPLLEQRDMEFQQTAQQRGYSGEGAFLTLDFTALSARLNTADIHKLISGENTLKCFSVYFKVMNNLRLSCLRKYRIVA